MKKTNLLIITILAAMPFMAFSQGKGKQYFFKEIEWTIVLPAGFVVRSTKQNNAASRKGKKIVEHANKIKSDSSKTITLIGATKNKFNLFNATIAPFNAELAADWNAISKQRKDVMFKSFSANIAKSVIDSVSSTLVIDGVTFDKYTITVTVDHKVLFHSLLLSCIYGGYDLGITYVYVDEVIRREIETMLRRSKFGK